MTANMALVFTHGKIAVSTKAIGTMVSSTATAFTDNRVGRSAAENGKKANVSRGSTRSDDDQNQRSSFQNLYLPVA